MLAPGSTVGEKLDNIKSYGFEGIEARVRDVEATPADLSELEEALVTSGLGVGAVVLVGSALMTPFDVDTLNSKLAIAKKGLEIGVRLGVGAFVTPEYRPQPLPLWYPSAKLRPEERDLFYGFLGEVADYAEKIGGTALLEPINRYETHFYHTIAEVAAVIDDIGSDRIKMVVDFFHMNIEEVDIAASIAGASGYIQHVQLADSNRQVPGRGHTQFRPGFAALRRIGYEGYLALECRIPADPERELPECACHLSRCLEDSVNA